VNIGAEMGTMRAEVSRSHILRSTEHPREVIVKSPLIVRNAPSRPLLPAGEYQAQLTDVAPYANDFGERLEFCFTVTQGPHTGAVVKRRTTVRLTPRNKLAETIQALGHELTARELSTGIDLAQLIGARCRITVIHSQDRAKTTYASIAYIMNTAVNDQECQTHETNAENPVP